MVPAVRTWGVPEKVPGSGVKFLRWGEAPYCIHVVLPLSLTVTVWTIQRTWHHSGVMAADVCFFAVEATWAVTPSVCFVRYPVGEGGWSLRSQLIRALIDVAKNNQGCNTLRIQPRHSSEALGVCVYIYVYLVGLREDTWAFVIHNAYLWAYELYYKWAVQSKRPTAACH